MRKDMTSKLLLTGLAAFGTAQIAEAGTASSYAYLEIQDFIFQKAGGGQIVPGNDINVLGSPTNAASASSTLNGTTVNTQNLSGLNTAQAIQGAVVAEDTFTNQVLPTSFSRGDTAGSGDVLDIGNGADAVAIAETDLEPVNTGRAGSELNLNVSFDFVSLQDLDSQISFDAIWARIAEIDPDLVAPSDADANTTFSVSIGQRVGGSSVEVYSEDFGLSDGVSADTFFSSADASGSNSFSDTIPTLLQGETYRLTIDHGASTRATAVPSPTAAFAGLLGLAGLGMRRRRSSK